MEVYGRVRWAVQVEGMSERQAAREFGLSRKTIRKMLEYSAPPGYQRKKPVARPKLGPSLGIIDQILEDDEARPKKQRHTARRIYDRLKEEHAFTGGHTIVKDCVRGARLRHKEVFVPLAHPPGDAQADFGEALVVIGGVEQKGHFLCVDLPHSDDCFVVIFPAENTESFCEGHTQAFAYFGGVPRTILYDNTKIAVVEITGDGERKTTEEFSCLESHYLFEAKFGRPGKGNDKGNVEGLVGYARRNFMVPVLRLMETFSMGEVSAAIRQAQLLQAISFDAVKHLVLCLGNSGTGKTHIALALAACHRGMRVRFTTAAALVHELIEARDEKRLLRFQKHLLRQDLLIVDERGFVPLSKTGAEMLFELFSQRYERGSTLVTSNLPFAEWTEVLGSEQLTGALLDRLTHHVHILEMNGDSYRLKDSKRKRAAERAR